MTELFGRRVFLQLGNQTTAQNYEGFRIRFSVEKTLKREPNSATIEIYGLNRTSIANYLAADRDLRVRLLAGHRSGTPALLFDGFPVKDEGLVFDQRAGERVLKIKAKDGLRRYERARVNLTLGQASTLEDVLVECAKSLGLPIDAIDAPANVQLTQGTTLAAPTEQILDQLALSSNATWSIQDGKFQFLQKAGRRANGEGPLFSYELGNYVGTPRRKDKGVELTAILQGAVVPGSLFRLRTKDGLLDGDYKVHEVKYTGDNFYDTEFYAVILGKPYVTAAEAANAERRATAASIAQIEAAVDDAIGPARGIVLGFYLDPLYRQ
jgi:hypothetical protein